MIVVISGIIIVAYCLYSLLTIDKFIKNILSETTLVDTLWVFAICIWLLVQFFFQSGIICAIGFIPMFFTIGIHPKKRERLLYMIMLTTLVLVVSFVVLNKLWFNVNLWTFKIENVCI